MIRQRLEIRQLNQNTEIESIFASLYLRCEHLYASRLKHALLCLRDFES
jgi:hypothetical protein